MILALFGFYLGLQDISLSYSFSSPLSSVKKIEINYIVKQEVNAIRVKQGKRKTTFMNQ